MHVKVTKDQILWERKMFVGPTRQGKLQRASGAKIEYKNTTRGNSTEKNINRKCIFDKILLNIH